MFQICHWLSKSDAHLAYQPILLKLITRLVVHNVGCVDFDVFLS